MAKKAEIEAAVATLKKMLHPWTMADSDWSKVAESVLESAENASLDEVTKGVIR